MLGLGLTGLSVAGPRSRDVLAAVAPDLDLSTEAFPFMTFRRVDLGMTPAHLARINYAGDLGYELWVAPEYQRELFDRIVAAGEPHGLRLFGMRALMSLRLEKSYGTWFREYRPIYTPAEGGITRYLRLDHDFIGRAAHEAEMAAGGPKRRLVAMVVEPDPDAPADVIGDEPIWHDGEVVGWVTSGGYGHHVGRSIALGYVPTELATPDGPGRRAASRSRSSAAAGRPGSSRSRCSTRRASGCASDRRPVGAGRRATASSSTAARSAFEPGDSVAVAILRAGERPGRRRDAVPRRRLRQLPRRGRRRRLRPDAARSRPRPGLPSSATRRRHAAAAGGRRSGR